MKNLENEKMVKKAYTYDVLSKVFKWLSVGLLVVGAVVGVAVGASAGIVTGLATFLGCGLAGFAFYLSSIMSEGQSMAVADKIKAQDAAMTDLNDANKLLIKENESTKNADKYYTVDLDALNSQKNMANNKKPVETSKTYTETDLEK